LKPRAGSTRAILCTNF